MTKIKDAASENLPVPEPIKLIINKPFKNLRYYEVIDNKGKLLERFDDWSHKKPFHCAKEYVKNNS